MSWVPYTGAGALARIAARATVVRVVLGVALIALVLAAAAAARHPELDKQPLLKSKGGGMIVLDLSASIDAYARIGNALTDLAARGGRYGLVIFSSQAYLALPPGTPASALKPFARQFTLPKAAVEGAQATFPENPWTRSFAFGTQISRGLELARVKLLESGARDPAVILISDLADDTSDQQRVPTVIESYKRNGISLDLITLEARQGDEEYFKRLIGPTRSTTGPCPERIPLRQRLRTRASPPRSSSLRSPSPGCSP